MEPIKENDLIDSERKFFLYGDEFDAYEALGAFNNNDVENYGVPTIYFHGRFLKYNALVMTHLNVNIGDKFDELNMEFADFRTVLYIMTQAVTSIESNLSTLYHNIIFISFLD